MERIGSSLSYIGLVIALLCCSNDQSVSWGEPSRVGGSSARISIGNTASPNQYPWATLLSLPKGYCGGTLIAPNVVLTAGHCCQGDPASIISFTKAYIGLLNADNADNCVGCDIRRVKAVYINPTFNMTAFNSNNQNKIVGDIAVLILASPSTKQPATISSSKPDPLKLLRVLGWGITAATQQLSPTLQTTIVQTQTPTSCQGFQPKDFFEPAVSICSSSYGTWPNNYTSSSCEGDSGGPVIDPDTNELIGTVSYSVLENSNSKCGSYLRSVFMSVAQYRPWLQQYVNLTSSSSPVASSLTPSSAPSQNTNSASPSVAATPRPSTVLSPAATAPLPTPLSRGKISPRPSLPSKKKPPSKKKRGSRPWKGTKRKLKKKVQRKSRAATKHN